MAKSPPQHTKRQDETAHLLDSPENARRLGEAIDALNRGDFVRVQFDRADPSAELRVVRRYKNGKPVD